MGILTFGLIALALAIRLTKAVGLSDEGYYAVYIDTWLKGGIASSRFLNIHQTSELIVYPITVVYRWIVGGEDGLLLVLRSIFLFGSLASALIWQRFLSRAGYAAWASWLGAAFVLSFIPFGLPAPSYNTLGMQGLVAGLGAFGCAALLGEGRYDLKWTFVSAAGWAIAATAYPPLLAPSALFCVLALALGPHGWRSRLAYVCACGLCIVALWAIMFWVLSPGRIFDSISYQSAMSDNRQLGNKLAMTLAMINGNPTFRYLMVASVLIGVFRRWIGEWLASILIGGVIVGSLLTPTVLFAKSHDLVTLISLMGPGLLGGLWRKDEQTGRLIPLVYATSLAAALVTHLSTSNAGFNYCVGALPAASLALCGPPLRKPEPWLKAGAFALAIWGLLATSLFYFYGEISDDPHPARKPMPAGFFSGIRAAPDDYGMVGAVYADISPLLRPTNTVAVVGLYPGLALALPAKVLMASPFSLEPGSTEKARSTTHAFYARPDHRPDYVLVYIDRAYEAPNPMAPDFERWYQPVKEAATPHGRVHLYRRR